VPDPHAQTVQRIVEILSAERRRRGISQEALAAAAGVSSSCVQHLEHARSTPTLVTLLRLADALGLDPSRILRAAREASAANASEGGSRKRRK